MSREGDFLLVGVLSGVTQGVALMGAVSKGFFIPMGGQISPGGLGPVSTQSQTGTAPLMNPLTFTFGLPSVLVILVMFTASFLAGYVLADLGRATKSLLISQVVLFSFALGIPSAIGQLPGNLQAVFLFAFIAFFLFNVIGVVFGAFLGDW